MAWIVMSNRSDSPPNAVIMTDLALSELGSPGTPVGQAHSRMRESQWNRLGEKVALVFVLAIFTLGWWCFPIDNRFSVLP